MGAFSFVADGGRVDDGRGPVQLTMGPELVQNGLVQSPPQPGLSPRREPAVCGSRRNPERLRQIPSGAAAGQHIHHSGAHGPLVNRSRPASLRTRRKRRQQRSDKHPEFVRNQPLRQINTHDTTSCRIQLTPRETSSEGHRRVLAVVGPDVVGRYGRGHGFSRDRSHEVPPLLAAVFQQGLSAAQAVQPGGPLACPDVLSPARSVLLHAHLPWRPS